MPHKPTILVQGSPSEFEKKLNDTLEDLKTVSDQYVLNGHPVITYNGQVLQMICLKKYLPSCRVRRED